MGGGAGRGGVRELGEDGRGSRLRWCEGGRIGGGAGRGGVREGGWVGVDSPCL